MPFLDKLFRSLPDFKGKRKLARFFFKELIKSGSDILIEGESLCSYLLPNIKESIAFDLFINGIYERETNDFFLRRLPPSGVFLDLGANIGSITIPLLKQRPDLTSICVEAAPWIFKYLEKNLSSNNLNENTSKINKALWKQSGLKLPFYSPFEQFGKGSLASVFTKEAVMIETITIDDLLKEKNISRVDMVKIDIEGYEYFAFEGAKNLLQSEDAPDIYFEFVDWAQERAGIQKGAEQQLLRSFGYKIFLLNKNGDDFLETENIVKGSEMMLASKKIKPKFKNAK